MRKDFKIGKDIKNRLYSTYQVVGLNLDKFITILNRDGIETVNVRKKTNKKLILTIKNCYTEKFFAITGRLCYNVKKLKYSGAYLPIYWLYRNIGVAVGVLIFLCSACWFGGRIMGVAYSGTGSVYSSQVDDFLEEKGIGKWSAFSSVDLKKLGNEIFSSSNLFSFVNCTRNGNTLNIKLVAKSLPIDRLDKSQKQLLCDIEGVVEKVKVLRGTAMVGVGDKVKSGDLLIDGKVTIGEKQVETGIVGSVYVLYTKQFTFRTEKDDAQDIAEIFAQQTAGEGISCATQKSKVNGEYLYITTVTYRKIFSPS